MSEQVNYMQRVGHSRCVRCDFETSDDMTFEQQDAAMMAHLADKHPDWMGIGRAEPSPEPEAAPASEAQAPEVPEWYWGSRCVECGKQIPAGQIQHCIHGGYCNHHVPVALRAEIASLRENLAKYKNIADAVKGYTEYMNADGLISAFIKEQERLRAELVQLRARVAVLDAQEAALPELPAEAADDTLDGWYELAYEARCAQLLDALRAVQAKNGVIGNLAEGIVEEYSPCVIDESRPRLEWCVTHQTKRCGQKALYEKAVAAIAAYDALAGKDGE